MTVGRLVAAYLHICSCLSTMFSAYERDFYALMTFWKGDGDWGQPKLNCHNYNHVSG